MDDWNNIIPNCLKTFNDASGRPQQAATLDCLPAVFQNIITSLIFFVGAVAVILIMVAGFKFITSGGDAKQVEGARKTLTYAIIGLIIVLLSFFVIFLVSQLTGVTCIKQFGFGICL